MNLKKAFKKSWHFIWESDSILSWFANIIVAFVLIKFIIYPGLGFAMQTSYPIVAVVSSSMEHGTTHPCLEYKNGNSECIKFDESKYNICGKSYTEKKSSDIESYWKSCGDWYKDNTQITKKGFSKFLFKNGFNKGDIMILRGQKPENLDEGDTIVYFSKSAPYPIIHRIVKIESSIDERFTYITKGDHNEISDTPVEENQLIGKAILRIPYLGWIKIGFVNLIRTFQGAIIA